MEQVVFWAIWAALAVFMGYFYLHHAHGIRSFLYFALLRLFVDVPLGLTDTKSLDCLADTRLPQRGVFPHLLDDFYYFLLHTIHRADTSTVCL
mgnify:CR=1 FL=1